MVQKDNFTKKFLELAFGFYNLGKESISKVSNKIKKEYNINEAKSKKVARDLIKKISDSNKKISKMVVSDIEAVLKNHNLIKRKSGRKGKKK